MLQRAGRSRCAYREQAGAKINPDMLTNINKFSERKSYN